MKTPAQYRREFDGYCRTLTDAQVQGVIDAEKSRIKAHGKLSEISKVARILLAAAQAEQERRAVKTG